MAVIDLEMLERARLTPEQWQAVLEFCGHNFGNAINGLIGLATDAARQSPATLRTMGLATQKRYFEIMEELKKRQDDPQISQINAERIGDNGETNEGECPTA